VLCQSPAKPMRSCIAKVSESRADNAKSQMTPAVASTLYDIRRYTGKKCPTGWVKR
jgi:hypothetical protein